jgi:hypothetical protein
MESIEIHTLVDVTNTGVRRANQGTQLELDQFRNWSTLLQCIGLRAIIGYDHPPQVDLKSLKGLGFGSEYRGEHRVWTFTFRPDRVDEFAGENSSIDLLKQDLDMIPMIKNLTETVNIVQAVFSTTDTKFCNTVIQAK